LKGGEKMKKLIATVLLVAAIAAASAGVAHAAKDKNTCPVGAMCYPIDVTPTPSF
jgi:hypothetical protein